ncbi:hypothetical protein DL764_004732 [Monosporascus ibericus]|uniref:Major facilitator superfamily (MFS) profile domain-containing protein n=1 Tax=Monosporascus ibericus TaxID=155417 RepID=A0A4Q4TBX1_9PEZI|nr:hypothetical protein DL764_004732 [Monosporascus ibericus]
MSKACSPTGGVLPSEDAPLEADRPEILEQKDLELLGRQRPPSLPTQLVECTFVFTILLSMTMAEYTISGFNIVLPSLTESLHIPESARTWPAGVPNLTTGCLLLPCARFCDQYGGKAVFLAGHLWLFVWSLISGFSQNSTMLIVCRAMQGLGSAAFLPAGIALLGRIYRPGPRKNLVFGLYGACACIGFYIGIVIGAIASDYLNWRWFFWIGAILVGVVVVLGFLTIPGRLGDGDQNVRMDWRGLCTVVPGLILVVFALTDGGHAPDGWRTPYIFLTFIVGLLFLCVAVYVQGWVSAVPLLPAELFRPKYMKRLSVALFCSYGVFGVFLFYASFYIESALHITPMLTAAWFTPLAVGGVLLAVTGGFVLHVLPGRLLLIISGIGYILSVLLFALVPARSESGEPSITFLYWAYVFPAMCCGTIGVDIAFNVTNVFITTAMPARLQATAGALINSLLYLGLAFWLGIAELAVSTTVNRRGEENVDMRSRYKVGFWTGVGLAVVALCLTSTVNLGKAAADMTADEKAKLEQDASQCPIDGLPATDEEQDVRR